MNQLILQDNKNKNYLVEDPHRFNKHLIMFHTKNGKADFSLHEEKDHYFTVTPRLLEQVNSFIELNKK